MKTTKISNLIMMALLGCCSISSVSAQQASATGVQRPKLVVGIVIDQMRWDYLYRYQKRYTDGGFHRTYVHLYR